MKELIIVPCTREKIWDARPDVGAVPAKDAYTGRLFTTWRSYAEASGSPWRILSTRHGLLEPNTPVLPYNVTIAQALKDEALLALLRTQGEKLELQSFDQVVLLGRDWFKPLVTAMTSYSKTPCVLRPLPRA